MVSLNSTPVTSVLVRGPAKGGLLGRLLEFQNVPCQRFLIVISELHITIGNVLVSTVI